MVSRSLKLDFREAAGEGFDLKGAVIYGLALSAVIAGFSEMPDAAGVILVVLGGAGLGLFILIETRIKHPLLQVSLFRGNPGLCFFQRGGAHQLLRDFRRRLPAIALFTVRQGFQPGGGGAGPGRPTCFDGAYFALCREAG
ncbi:hypothetical protein [Dehalogenimonas alkenigignens]|uniref:hypothetical protein n=1 Tax=Dehalogenimonas alkenigignens TaxID=1217799 RepID=UPI0030B854EE